MSTLEAKVQECAGRLTDDELAELAAVDAPADPATLSTGLRGKVAGTRSRPDRRRTRRARE